MDGQPVDALAQIIEKRRARKRLPDPRTRRQVRERAGITQADLAQVLGVDRATVSRWESGERDPRPSQLEPYVAALERLMREAIG
jgi:transcriptional regulator with XRE-family HTH domain